MLDRLLPSSDPATWRLTDINGLITNLVNGATAIAGAVAMIYLILGAYNYLTAFGNEEKATLGKNTVKWAVVGAAVIVLARVIVQFIWSLAATGSPF